MTDIEPTPPEELFSVISKVLQPVCGDNVFEGYVPESVDPKATSNNNYAIYNLSSGNFNTVSNKFVFNSSPQFDIQVYLDKDYDKTYDVLNNLCRSLINDEWSIDQSDIYNNDLIDKEHVEILIQVSKSFY
ncbi:hypothetical protein [Lentilactobacillus kefiri]|uniref:hypothetical protein n=1 Tax=Lentilactobacillus kefiri TaxID=33962 RepID=UPI000BA5C818|nr:hypothetical protein [Lentilactobacillus kefiri]PAK82475.1 hypothetical protein B8W85_08210 [Lentilactobacillus kefiri]